MVLIGCVPPGRIIEQHDVFFGIASTLAELKKDMIAFWPEAKGKIHIDAWQKVTFVDGFKITVDENLNQKKQEEKLFFINLGGYKENEFEEYHYKVLTVAKNKVQASKQSRKTAFYKHCGFKGAPSHIDDEYGIDIDDFYKLDDLLLPKYKEQFQIVLTPSEETVEDEKHIGYITMSKLKI